MFRSCCRERRCFQRGFKMLELGDVKRSNRSFDIEIGFFVHIIHHVSGIRLCGSFDEALAFQKRTFPPS